MIDESTVKILFELQKALWLLEDKMTSRLNEKKNAEVEWENFNGAKGASLAKHWVEMSFISMDEIIAKVRIGSADESK